MRVQITQSPMQNYFTITVASEALHFAAYAWLFHAEKELGVNTHATVHFIKADGVFCQWVISPPDEHAQRFADAAATFGAVKWAN